MAVTTEASAATAPAHAASLRDRIGAFRSLGGNCEFGLVQRYCGSEASGLLRFSSTPMVDLIHALSSDFEAYGAPGDLQLKAINDSTYYCLSRKYNIWSNTLHTVGSIDPDLLLEREYGKIAHLKRKMQEELASGSHILVRKTGAEDDPADFERLARAVWRHGPSTLLRVTQAGAAWEPGSLRRVSDRLLEGSVRHFAPPDRAWDLDLEPWVALCDSAYASHHGLRESALVQAPLDDVVGLPGRARRHRGKHRTHRLSTFTRRLDADAFDPDRIYVFSAWVWIPEAFSGSRLYAALGYDRRGWRDADPTLRERWQRVWAAGRITPGDKPPRIGLGLVGDRSARFWSCGWRLHEGVVPDASADPPAVRIEPWFRRPVSAWLP